MEVWISGNGVFGEEKGGWKWKTKELSWGDKKDYVGCSQSQS